MSLSTVLSPIALKKKKSDVSFHLFFVEPQKSGGETYCAFDKRVVGEHEDTEVPSAI